MIQPPEPKMKVYTCCGVGHYLGSHAVVVAADELAAVVMLERKLFEHGIPQKVDPDELLEVDVSKPGAIILDDGDY